MATRSSRQDHVDASGTYAVDRALYSWLAGVAALLVVGTSAVWLVSARPTGVPTSDRGSDRPAKRVTEAQVDTVPSYAERTVRAEVIAHRLRTSQDPARRTPANENTIASDLDALPETIALRDDLVELAVPKLPLSEVEEVVPESAFLDHVERQVVTLDFNDVRVNPRTGAITRSSRADSVADSPIASDVRFAALGNRRDLEGLPLLGEDECHADPKFVRDIEQVSRTFATAKTAAVGGRRSSFTPAGSNDPEVQQAVVRILDHERWWPERVPTLVQILQVESPFVRECLVGTLADLPGSEADDALVDRVVFDTSPRVRRAALLELEVRPVEHYGERLIASLNHPWAPASINAARALVALEPSSLRDDLDGLLAEPDPVEPYQDDGRWVVRELVRVNHMRNCVLCHAPSTSENDPVRGLVPTPGSSIPIQYYGGQGGVQFVRADVTYVRQDFSLVHEVEQPHNWPTRQRFDYFVRERALSGTERSARANRTEASLQRRAQRVVARVLHGELDKAEADARLRALLVQALKTVP